MTRRILIAAALAFVGVFVVLPLAYVFAEAFSRGGAAYRAAVLHPDTLAAVRLTLTVVATAVAVNTTFGVAAAWAIAKFDFPGKHVLTTLLDLPFAVSPVISGMIFVLLFGRQGVLGPWLDAHDVKIIFATPGLILATTFVTFPFVARELIPVLEERGNEDEEAAVTLGASGWQTFWRVTLPNAKWGVLYGVLLTAARAAGEFGAVSVVSGHIRGETTTLPLQVEILYDQYDLAGAYAVASLLAAVAVVTLVLKRALGERLHPSHTQVHVDLGPEPQ